MARINFLKNRTLVFSVIICFLAFKLFFAILFRVTYTENRSQPRKMIKIYKRLISNLNDQTRLDKSGKYKILYSNVVYGPKYFDITLVSQCSANHIFTIKNFIDTWQGHISVAVFSDEENIYRTLWDVAKIKSCFEDEELKIQIVFPAEAAKHGPFKYSNDVRFENSNTFSCEVFESSVLNTQINYNWSYPYPINLLRNVATKCSTTQFNLLVDIDMIPSSDLQPIFMNLMYKSKVKNAKEVYVIPVFEILPNVPVPRNKMELIESVHKNEARPFYYGPCRNCQKLTRNGEWLIFGENSGTQVLYEVAWKHPWEPFFISQSNVPKFDERFKQYGMNRISQICELHVMGYKFLVLDNLFLIHKGFKMENDFHPMKYKDMENNRDLYETFKTELMIKYGKVDPVC